MKRFLLLLIPLFIIIAGIAVYRNTGSRAEQRYYQELAQKEYKEWVDIVIPGLRVLEIDDDSLLLKDIDFLGDLGSSTDSLAVGDVITGISLNESKTNLAEVITRERTSEDFIPIDSEEELYSELMKMQSATIVLGIVRVTPAGTGHFDRPDLARVSFENSARSDLGVTLVPNNKELTRKEKVGVGAPW